jgi:hypothetical protein
LARALPRPDRSLSKGMLKISTIDDAHQRRLVLEGKLIGPWAAELRSACDAARAGLDGGDLIVDMEHLTAISQEGENVLLELIQEGVKFRCRGVFTKQVLKQVARRANEALEKSIGDCTKPGSRSQQ